MTTPDSLVKLSAARQPRRHIIDASTKLAARDRQRRTRAGIIARISHPPAQSSSALGKNGSGGGRALGCRARPFRRRSWSRGNAHDRRAVLPTTGPRCILCRPETDIESCCHVTGGRTTCRSQRSAVWMMASMRIDGIAATSLPSCSRLRAGSSVAICV